MKELYAACTGFFLRAAGVLFGALTLTWPSLTVSILWAAHCLTGLTSSLAELIKSFKVREVGQISSEHLSPRCEPVPYWVCPPLAQDQWLHYTLYVDFFFFVS